MEMEIEMEPVTRNYNSSRGEFQPREEENQSEDHQDKNTSIQRNLVKRLHKFGDDSSFGATVYMFKSKSILKRILWGVIVLAAIAGFCAVTSQSILMLMEQPIATSIVQNRQKELEFPAVTICSLNFLNATRLQEFGEQLNHDILVDLEAIFGLTSNETCLASTQNITNNTDYIGGFYTLVTETGRQELNDLVIECFFGGRSCKEDLVPTSTVSGTCLTFNGQGSGPPRIVRGTGVRQGLRIEIENGNQKSFTLNHDFGYNVIVHNRDEPPTPASDGVVVGLSSNLYVGMRRMTFTDSTQFFSGRDCIENEEITSHNLTFSNFTEYSPSLCLNDCYFTYVANQCNCVERGLYTPVQSPYAEMRSCELKDLCCERIAFQSLEACDCPLKCETVEYSLTASSATNSDSQAASINVYYETLVTEAHETTDSYSPWSLISDIGGNTGLFLGFTLLTIGEVVLLLLAMITDFCCSSCKRRKEKEVSGSP